MTATPISASANPEREVTHAEARKHMARWHDYRGNTPFGSMSSGFATDRANSHLNNASAILRVLSTAFEDASTLGDKSELANMNPSMIGAVLDGVSDLINLGSFAVED